MGQRRTSSVQTGSSLVLRLAADLLSRAQSPGFLPEPALHSSGSPPCPTACAGLLPQDVEMLLQPYPLEGYFKSKFRSGGSGILSPEEQDNCLDIIRFKKKKKRKNPILPFLSVELKKKKIPSLPSLQLAGCWTLSFREEGERKDEPLAAENLFLAEQLVEDFLAAGGISPPQRQRCQGHLPSLGIWL